MRNILCLLHSGFLVELLGTLEFAWWSCPHLPNACCFTPTTCAVSQTAPAKRSVRALEWRRTLRVVPLKSHVGLGGLQDKDRRGFVDAVMANGRAQEGGEADARTFQHGHALNARVPDSSRAQHRASSLVEPTAELIALAGAHAANLAVVRRPNARASRRLLPLLGEAWSYEGLKASAASARSGAHARDACSPACLEKPSNSCPPSGLRRPEPAFTRQAPPCQPSGRRLDGAPRAASEP